MKKEALAVVHAVKHFKIYLLSKEFCVITNNNVLYCLHSLESKGQMAHWIMDLQEFEFDIQLRQRISNHNIDALSRLNHNKTVDKVCPISLTLDTNCFEAKRNNSVLSKVVESKEQVFPKPPPWALGWKDSSILRFCWEYWDQLFICNGLFVRSLENYKYLPEYAASLIH